MSWLVVNADDGGLAPSTDEAILRCARAGIVRAVSVVAAGPTAAEFVPRALEAGLEVGLHLNLTEGHALAGPAPSLTDEAGVFSGPKSAVWSRAGTLDEDEVRAEVKAQWERLLELGARPVHVDGHNHVQVLPEVRAVLAGEMDASLWMRFPTGPEPIAPLAREMAGPWRRADHFTGLEFCREPTANVFLESLDASAVVTEFMVHPGSRPGSRFASARQRDEETVLLCSRALAQQIENRGYRTAGFGSCG